MSFSIIRNFSISKHRKRLIRNVIDYDCNITAGYAVV